MRADSERAASTIHAANADDGLRAALATGRLERWARDESLGGIPSAPRRSRGDGREQAAREKRRKAELREARRRVDAALRRQSRAAGRAAKAREELAGLEEAERAAAAELADAERRLGELG